MTTSPPSSCPFAAAAASAAPTAATEQVSHGLNLQLILNDPSQMPVLMEAIAAKSEATFAALQELHFVHFARFLPSHDNSALQVITSFDGPLDAYALDFVIAIGDIFDAILGFVKNAPPLPVSQYPSEFYAFVKQNNRVIVAPPALMWDDYPVYSAYPSRTVIDIVGPRKTPPPVRPVAPSTVDLSDVQGNILSGYRAHSARHYSVRLHNGPAARALLSQLVDGDGIALPKVTTAQRWTVKPAYMLNIGWTVQGLRALGVPPDQFTHFSDAFLQGSGYADRAAANGDTGASSPELWEIGGAQTEVHLLLSLFVGGEVHYGERDRRHQQLLDAFAAHDIELVHLHEARAMPDGKVQFGYKDGIAQPRLAGLFMPKPGTVSDPDWQPLAGVGEFLLGNQYTSVYGGTSLGQLPAALCQNGTFAAVRVLDQDVAAFESSLDQTAKASGVDREWVAAKLMGRWRDGRPLAAGSKLDDGLNAFDYAPSLAHPELPNDHQGLQCPVGAHIRRMNPRSSLVAGQPYSRRLIRRGMPYGPAWSADNPNARRGLFGLFICADLERQFEFLTQQWSNSDFATSGIKGTQDPIIGSQTLGGQFEIPMPAGQTPITVKTPRWTTTRGSLYVLMPGMNSLRWLAKGEGFDDTAATLMGPAQWISEPPAIQTQSRFAPDVFDPMDPSFLRNPYPYYAVYREHAPVALVRRGDYQSYWVFSHELCQEAALAPDTFLKQTASTPHAGRGLFFMDDPEHARARSALDPEFMQAIAQVSQSATRKAQQALALFFPQSAAQTGAATASTSASSFDLIANYANPVLRNVFMDMFGWPAAQWKTLGDLVEVMLQAFNPMLPLDERTPSYAAAGQIMQMLGAQASQCPVQHTSPTSSSTVDAQGLFCRIQGLTTTPALSTSEAMSSALDFLLGGYLSSVFLASTGIYNLLTHPSAGAAYRKGDAALRANAFQEMKRFDAPFQLADRYAAHDVTLGGVLIPKNALVSLVYGSANHDASVYGSTAEQFDIERVMNRTPNANMVFGAGEHRCIGAPMADQAVPIVIDTFLEQCQQATITAGAALWRDDPYFRGFRQLAMQL